MQQETILHISDTHSIVLKNIKDNNEEELFELIVNKKCDLQPLNSIHNKRRRIEWLSTRVAIKNMTDDSVDIRYDSNGKPQLIGYMGHISISHSQNMLALSFSKKHKTGVDIQKVSPKINAIKHKFLTTRENEREIEDPVELTKYWAAKEAMFKYHGEQDYFLRQNFEINRIRPSGKVTEVEGVIFSEQLRKEVKLHLIQLDDYILAYVVNS
ncbi:MAG: hypothetical protein CMO34_05790 [Verrucomicrobia bacterium]|nr:hypothetical protein [Verrucomicrobiota bacterium]